VWGRELPPGVQDSHIEGFSPAAFESIPFTGQSVKKLHVHMNMHFADSQPRTERKLATLA
jgi:hypothetical protein